METGSVIGNVSRTRHPCGMCRALVETCGHWQPFERLSRRRSEAERLLAERMTLDEFARQFRTGAPSR